MSPDLQTEYLYRLHERLAIMSDGGRIEVTDEMMRIATKEAEEWIKKDDQ